MQQPPNQQHNTFYPPQQFQSPYPQPWQQPPMMPPPPKRKPKKLPSIWVIVGIAVALVLLAGTISYTLNKPTPPLTLEQFKASARDTTVESLDKNGNADKGANVYFTCKISSFVKDDSGNTAGANVNGTDTTTFAVVQVSFPDGTDISKINQGDTLEVWGTDKGVFSGQNALGGTVQEVGVSAAYLVDVTTGYAIP